MNRIEKFRRAGETVVLRRVSGSDGHTVIALGREMGPDVIKVADGETAGTVAGLLRLKLAVDGFEKDEDAAV